MQRLERGAKEKSDFVQRDKLSALEGKGTTQSACEGPNASGPGGKEPEWLRKEAVTARGDLKERLQVRGRGVCFEGGRVSLGPKIASHWSEKYARDCWCLGLFESQLELL